MKKLWFKTLLRSPVKTAVTFLLLLASAFLLTRNLTDYLSSRSAYQEALKNYEGVLTVEHPYLGKAKMSTPLFLLTEPGMPENRWHPQEQLHVQSLDAETVEALSALPYVERTEQRYMTAGVSDYERVYNPRRLYKNISSLDGLTLRKVDAAQGGTTVKRILADRGAFREACLAQPDALHKSAGNIVLASRGITAV